MIAGARTGGNPFANIIPVKAGGARGALSQFVIIAGISRVIQQAAGRPSIINVSNEMNKGDPMRRVVDRVGVHFEVLRIKRLVFTPSLATQRGNIYCEL